MKVRQTCRFLCVVAGLVLSACGGGGGGGGETPAIADAAYDGIRDQAYLDAANAETLILGAYGSPDFAEIVPLAAVGQENLVTLNADFSDPFQLVTLFSQTAEKLTRDRQVQTQALLVPAEECLNYPEGTLTDNLTESTDGTTDRVSGTITYINCDVGDGIVLDGNVQISASINVNTLDMNLSMTMNPLGYSDGFETYSLIGSLAGDITSNLMVFDLTINMTLDTLTDAMYWLNDYVIHETDEFTGIRSTVSGRFYDSGYGYVDFETDPLQTIYEPYNTSESTYDGLLYFYGSSGSQANLWLGVNQEDYCINGINQSGAFDLGTCVNQAAQIEIIIELMEYGLR